MPRNLRTPTEGGPTTILPPEAAPLWAELAPASTRPTALRFAALLIAANLATGRRTVDNLRRTLGRLAPGHRSDYQRVLCRAPWSGLPLGCALAGYILRRLVPDRPVILVGDDTVGGHPGRHAHGKARHRDPVRSSHAYTAWRWGHKWVVLAVLVRFPFAARPWALPVLVDLHRSGDEDSRRRRPHRTLARLICRLLRALLLRFPDRRFVFVGDSCYGTHEVARFAHRHRSRLAPVSKLHPEANLFEPPPPYRGPGRPRVKGERRPKPCQAVETARRRRRLTVGWYGEGTRRVGVFTGTGHWYKAGRGLVPIRWVHVRDLEGTHRDEYFYTTDPGMGAGEIVTRYAGRWSLQCTFQESRAHLHSETTRGWSRRTVLRATPCLLGLYSVVALLLCHGYLTEEDVVEGLTRGGRRAGLPEQEIAQTICDGLRYGRDAPLPWPDKLRRPAESRIGGVRPIQAPDDDRTPINIPRWPDPPAEGAYLGLAGRIVRAIEPQTESDPLALLAQLLVSVGNVVGRGPQVRVESTPHHLNEFAVLVGESAVGRKGTSADRVVEPLREADEGWAGESSPGYPRARG